MHIFAELQEKKQYLTCRQAELFVIKYKKAPLSALYDEIQHQLDLWEAEAVQPFERQRLELDLKQSTKESSQWLASLALCRAHITTLKQEGFSETQQALFHWVPHYLEKLESFHTAAQQALSLRMWLQLVRLRVVREVPTKKKESTAALLKICLHTWEQKSQRVEEAFQQIFQEAYHLAQAGIREEIIRANKEALTSAPFLLDEAGRKTLFLWLHARGLSLYDGASQEKIAASPPLRISQKS